MSEALSVRIAELRSDLAEAVADKDKCWEEITREALAPLVKERRERMVMAVISGNVAETRKVVFDAPASAVASMAVHLADAILAELDKVPA